MFSSKTTWLADMRCRCNVATRVLEVGWHASFACLWLWTCCRWTPVAICEAWANQEKVVSVNTVSCKPLQFSIIRLSVPVIGKGKRLSITTVTCLICILLSFQFCCRCQSFVRRSVCQSRQSAVSFAISTVCNLAAFAQSFVDQSGLLSVLCVTLLPWQQCLLCALLREPAEAPPLRPRVMVCQ